MDYYDETRKRARERLKSPWTIPLRVFCFILIGTIWSLFAAAVWQLHLLRYPGQHINDLDHTFAPIGMTIPPLFASIPLGLLLGNFVAWLIPPVGRSLDKVGNFHDSQVQLWNLGKWLVFPSIFISLFFALI